jgi:DNA recombination protein RmuC
MPSLDVLSLLIGLASGAAFCWVLMRSKLRADIAGAVSKSEFDALANEKSVLTGKLEALQEAYDNLQDALSVTRSELTEQRERAVRADADKRALDQRLKDQQTELEKMREQLKLEFRSAATTIFDEMGKKFSTQSEKQIGDILNPLRERLGEFQKLVGDSFTTQGKEQHALKSEIERIVKMNEQMRLQTEGLTKALRGDVKAQGNWGEVMLERILEESGLREGQDYVLQGAEMGLSGAEGNRLQPDVVVRLPDNKHIIVDSKVSLVAYERYCSEADETAKQLHLRDFLKSIKAHINGLEQKRYQSIEKLGTPDFVLMFLPVEGAYSLALQHDTELHGYAWGKKIVLVCPATLFASLRTIASLWRIEQQNQNAQEIARQAGAMYDKLVGFVEDMQAIDRNMSGLHKSYDAAMNKLVSGRGNLIGSAEKLKQLGAKTAKSLPRELANADDGEEQDAPALSVATS